MKETCMALYVHYGCHWCAPSEWLNFDASPTLRLERLPVVGRLVRKNARRFPANVNYGDIVKGLPLDPESCDGVYCSHVLEHLALEDCRLALQNTYWIMKKGAVFRMVLPDLEYYIGQYISSKDPERCENFMKSTSLGEIKRPGGVRNLLIESFGNSRHRWMWDFDSLSHELSSLEFQRIRRARFGDSQDQMFRLVEQEERWKNALGIECKK